MIYLLAILLPSLALLIRGHVLLALICFILHLTLIGWIPAALWAVFVIQRDDENYRHRQLMKSLYRNR